MSLLPADITARSEHTGLANAGEMGSECIPCARAAGVQFFYDDPLNTPITNLEVQLADASGAILVDGIATQTPASRGVQDAAPGTGMLRPDLGGVAHSEVPVAAGALTATTNASQNIPAVIEDAWHIELDIVTGLENFETSMKAKFQTYVDEWEEEGVAGAAADLGEGIMRGIGNWWDGEKDFWGTAWGALKSSVAAIDAYLAEANAEGLPMWVPGAAVWNLLGKLGRDAAHGMASIFEDEGVIDFLSDLGEVMRAFLAGDIDRIIAGLQNLTGIEDLSGTLGEFGTMLKDALEDGIDWMRDMIEVLRRTPVLNLIVNTAMRCLLLMTPNFWAKVLGEGIGFVIPELLIWLITTIIAALSAGAGAAVLAARCAGIASKIRRAIKGGQHVAKILSFLDEIKPIFSKIGDLAKKLRQSIEEVGERVMDQAHRVVRSSRYWRTRLDDLARQGHGPQRHEGDVTDRQLLNRSLHGFDPMTNSPVDHDKFFKKYGVHYDPIAHGTPPDFGGRMISVPGKGDLPIVLNSKTRHI
ncbi:MAG: hypothetical protein AAFR98_13055, partial [Pseudomonadota bacterium]